MAWFFGLVIFLSAFLLFQVQPMISKFILPWFGGGSSVWTVSQLFFQAALLCGYTYADALNRLPPLRQVRRHLIFLGGALLWIVVSALTRSAPITPDPRLKPVGGEFPAWQVLLVLAVSVGIPYLLLSTTSSLVQAWYRAAHRQSSPYAYYVLSNAASFLALLSYPVLVEPNWTVHQQALFWSGAFVVYLVLIAACALWLARICPERELSPALSAHEQPPDPAQAGSQTPEGSQAGLSAQPSRAHYLSWIGLAACSSVMLLATTNQITQDVASVPFLWVLPLSLYLLSFVVAFNNFAVRLRGLLVILTLPAMFLGLLSLDGGVHMPVSSHVAANGALLFIICLLCHTELYARRPHPRYLTSFYLMVSIGGALGGLLVGIIAPFIFNDFWEYPLGLAFSGGIAAAIAMQSRGEWIYRLRWPVAAGAFLLAVWVLYIPLDWVWGTARMTRSFYGVLRVRETEVDGYPGYNLVHGAILHGSQVSASPYRYRPTKYYTATSGVGLAYQFHPNFNSGERMRVGVVGLGVGTLAAYGRTGDLIRFYEINPDVVEIARDERYFTYLQDSQADVEIVLGDARLSMERELQQGRPQRYNLLAVDAFTGDSIPTHLINREAVALYLAHLDDNGVLAFHISNRHLDLEPITALLAEEYGLSVRRITSGLDDWQGSISTWVLLTRDASFFDNLPDVVLVRSPNTKPGLRLWTDDYSNLIQVLRD